MAGRNEITFHVVARDMASRTLDKVGRELDKTGKAADGFGDDLDDAGKGASQLDRQLAETQGHLKDLAREFDRTGDRGLFKDIRKDKRTITQLTQMKKLLGEVADEAAEVGSKQLLSGVGDTLSALPSQLKGAAIALGVTLAAGAAPLIGGVIGSAVLGSVGAGGIIGGIALAARDERVQSAAADVGHRLMAGLESVSQPFVEPLIASLDDLGDAGSAFIEDFRDDFASLAPLFKPLTGGLSGFLDELGPGLHDAFVAAKPVIRLLSNELPEVGEALGDMFTSISEGGDGAVMALHSFLNILEWTLRTVGTSVEGMSNLYESLVRISELGQRPWAAMLGDVPLVGDAITYAYESANNLIVGLDDAKDSSDDFAGSQGSAATATDRATQAMKNQHAEILAQTDPMFDLIERLKTLKAKQADYNEAVKDYGKKSPEAKQASLDLAQAAIALQGSVVGAGDSLRDKLSPAMLTTLEAAGLTEQQIRDVEAAFKSAKTAADRLAGEYLVAINFEVRNKRAAAGVGFFEGLDGRASGGSVEPNRPYVVGENGPEIVTFGQSGYVHNASATRSMLSGGAGYGSIGVPTGYRDVRLPGAASGGDRYFLSMLQEFFRANPGVRLVST